MFHLEHTIGWQKCVFFFTFNTVYSQKQVIKSLCKKEKKANSQNIFFTKCKRKTQPMPNIIALDAKQHKNFAIVPKNKFSFAEKDTICPILITELEKMVFQSPIVFNKTSENQIGVFTLQGLVPNRNQFVSNNHKWLGTYIPFKYRCYPFCLVLDGQNKSDKLILAFNDDAGVIKETKEPNSIRLFLDDGAPSEHLRKVMALMSEANKAEQATKKCLGLIEELDLLSEWKITLKSEEKEKEITGLLKIDTEKLDKLKNEDFLALRNENALPLIYGHLFSLRNITRLTGNKKSSAADSALQEPNLKERALQKQKINEKAELDSLVKNLLLDYKDHFC